MNPTNFIGKVKNIGMLNKRDLVAEFEHVSPSEMDFRPGQFVSLKAGETSFRPYSIASDYKNKNIISVIVSVEHSGVGSNYLKQLKVGDQVNYLGPAGLLKLKKPYATNLYFFATGTGIAPFLSMFYKLLDDKFEGNINVFFGVKNEDELFAIDILDKFKPSFKSFNYQILFSESLNPNISKQFLTTEIPGIVFENSHFYLCGHPSMIESVSKDLKQECGVNEENIIFEKFTVTIKPS